MCELLPGTLYSIQHSKKFRGIGMIVHEVDKMEEQTREDRREQLQEGKHKDTVTFWHRNDEPWLHCTFTV